VQFLPRVLGVFLALLALAAVGHALATSVRRRRHDLGIVRALGFVGRDVLQTITAQSWTLIAIGLVAGVPLGVAIGRLAWKVVADGIGVHADAGTSLGAIGAVALVSALAGALLAVLPGLAAARQRTIDALRVE
jgi:ABC-type antimicrobial peptide transport system permease subunit